MKINKLDALFSQYIRMRAMDRVHGCERCGAGKTSYKELQCSHFIGRSNRHVRYNEDNAVGLCAGCHMYLDSRPIEHVEFFKKLLGDRYDLLLAQARIIYPKPDEKLITIWLQNEIKKLEAD